MNLNDSAIAYSYALTDKLQEFYYELVRLLQPKAMHHQ
jgi:hypothetical protein